MPNEQSCCLTVLLAIWPENDNDSDDFAHLSNEMKKGEKILKLHSSSDLHTNDGSKSSNCADV